MTAKRERNAEIFALRVGGMLMREIGEKYGLSRGRVGQILNYKPSPRNEWTSDKINQLRALWPQNMSLVVVAETVGFSISSVREMRKKLGLPLRGNLGHRRSPKTIMPKKLTAEEVVAIRTLVSRKMMSAQSCARLYGIHHSMVGHIVNGRRWASVSAEVSP